MNPPRQLLSRVWLLLLVFAAGLLVWTNRVRMQRVEYATGIAQDELRYDGRSPTGHVGGIRELIVPEHNARSYHWIAQTQQMFAREEWRIRHIDYENAPFGHEVHAASPYRWWLGLVAWLDQVFSGRSPGLSVERAALLADPLLHLLLLLGTTVFVAWRFGAFPAALLSLGTVAVFPFAGEFIPGAPDDSGLGLIFALWSVLLLLAGIGTSPAPAPRTVDEAAGAEANRSERHSRRWFMAAGITGGIGLWLDLAGQVPILLGIVLGGLIAAWVTRSEMKGKGPGGGFGLPQAWRTWALGGAATSLAAYLVEFFPDHLGAWQLRVNHPLYGLAWLGGGELLAQAVSWIQGEKPARKGRAIVLAGLAIAALVAVPVVQRLTDSQGFLAAEISSLRLTKLPDGIVASSFGAWVTRDGLTATVWAAILPLLLIGPAIGLLLRNGTRGPHRIMLALTVGPALVALGFACRELGWWNRLDGVLLTLLVAATAAIAGSIKSRLLRWGWAGLVSMILFFGGSQLLPPLRPEARNALTQPEVEELIERDMAHWLAKHIGPGPAVVLATPYQTNALNFYGGLRGLGSFGWENRDGYGAAVRIASATTAEEALELIRRREITHIIIPTWDPYLDEYARLGLGQLEGSFMNLLHLWALPSWLRPIPYQLPTIAGLEGQSVTILEVVEEQDEAAAASRLAEYFIEMGQMERAATASKALQRFPADLGVMVARAQFELAGGDAAGVARTVESLRSRLGAGADRNLPWDRRVSLAVVLARSKQMELARVQVQRCLAELDEARLRSLTTGSLYRLQVLGKAFKLSIVDGHLRELALDLLPPDLRSRL